MEQKKYKHRLLLGDDQRGMGSNANLLKKYRIQQKLKKQTKTNYRGINKVKKS